MLIAENKYCSPQLDQSQNSQEYEFITMCMKDEKERPTTKELLELSYFAEGQIEMT